MAFFCLPPLRMEHYRRETLIAFFAVMLFFAAAKETVAGGIVVTRVSREEKGGAALCFNGVLTVGGITTDGGGGGRLRMPCYVSRRGARYPHVRLLTRQAREAAERAVLRGAVENTPAGGLSYKINGIRPYGGKSRSLKGFATVVFNDAVAVESKVMLKEGRAWVAWPAVKEGETWRRVVTVDDRRLRADIERDICDRSRSMLKD